jgi:hypothetical protein
MKTFSLGVSNMGKKDPKRNWTDNKIHFFALRRRDPVQQPLLNEVHYELKQKWLRA